MSRRGFIVSLVLILLISTWTPMADEVLHDLPVLQQSVSDDVNGAEDYTIVYQLDIPDDSEYNNQPIPYSVDSS